MSESFKVQSTGAADSDQCWKNVIKINLEARQQVRSWCMVCVSDDSDPWEGRQQVRSWCMVCVSDDPPLTHGRADSRYAHGACLVSGIRQ